MQNVTQKRQTVTKKEPRTMTWLNVYVAKIPDISKLFDGATALQIRKYNFPSM